MKFKNISPLGELRIPAIRQIVPGGAVFDVAPEVAEAFAVQPSNYEPADKPAKDLVTKLAAAFEAEAKADEAASTEGII